MALTGMQFVRYARAQIAEAATIRALHRRSGQMCSCGRTLPCPVAVSVDARGRWFATRLAHMADPTVELPVLTPSPGPRTRRRHRRPGIRAWRR